MHLLYLLGQEVILPSEGVHPPYHLFILREEVLLSGQLGHLVQHFLLLLVLLQETVDLLAPYLHVHRAVVTRIVLDDPVQLVALLLQTLLPLLQLVLLHDVCVDARDASLYSFQSGG